MDREEMMERERERARVRWAGAVAEGVDSNNDVWSRCGHVKSLLEVCAVARALGGLVEEDADEAPPAARDGGFYACAVARRVLPERVENPAQTRRSTRGRDAPVSLCSEVASFPLRDKLREACFCAMAALRSNVPLEHSLDALQLQPPFLLSCTYAKLCIPC